MQHLTEELLRSGMFGLPKEFGGRGLLDDSMILPANPVGHLAREPHLVGNTDHCHAVFRELRHDIEDLFDHLWV
ncbi:hypothetical protein J6524_10175 [Bradyrhizobium sp. WSM 1738]|nr:hypothetical protein [Bradyrhizobium hereditatis]